MTTQAFQFATDDTWQFEGVSAPSPWNEDCGCGGACGGRCGGRCGGGCGGGCKSNKPTGCAAMSLPDFDGELMMPARMRASRPMGASFLEAGIDGSHRRRFAWRSNARRCCRWPLPRRGRLHPDL